VSSYILRNLDPDLWATVKARAKVDNMPLKAVIFKLLALYGEGKIAIVARKV